MKTKNAKCQRCRSKRVAGISGKCSDCCSWSMIGDEMTEPDDGYVPGDMGIGGGDYIEFAFCLECGQIQGEFPRPPTEIETGEEADEEDDES